MIMLYILFLHEDLHIRHRRWSWLIDGLLYHNHIVLSKAFAVGPLSPLASHPFQDIQMIGNFPRTINKWTGFLVRRVSNVRKNTHCQGCPGFSCIIYNGRGEFEYGRHKGTRLFMGGLG